MIVLSSFAILAVILSIVFLLKKGELNTMFAIILFLFSINVALDILYWNFGQKEFSAYFIYGHLVPLSLFGPLFYLSIKRIISKAEFVRADLLHLIPLLATLILYGGKVILQPVEKIDELNDKPLYEYSLNFPLFDYFLVALLLIYSIVTYVKINSNNNKEGRTVMWLRYSAISFVCFASFYGVYFILVNLSILKIEHDCFITLLMSLSLAGSVYFIDMHRVEIKKEARSEPEPVPVKKYKTTGLNSEISIELKNNLGEIMEKERPYLDSELRLDDLAQKLGVNRSQASQVINEHFDSSFFDFVNKYRIQEAERLLLSSNMTISEIAYQSGFNNKVSFYRSFKKFKRMTPLQLRENAHLKKPE